MTIILNEITNAKFDENVTISGILVNKDSTGLFNQVVTLTIGDEEVNVTTKAGVFQYTTLFRQLGEKMVTANFETKVVGTNNVTFSYGGNACYNSYETSTTFNVIAKAE